MNRPAPHLAPLARRALFATAASLALLAVTPTQAWSWNWGGGERVQGDGKTAREARPLAGFDGISLSGDFELKVRQSGTPRFEIEGDGNLLPYVETRVVETRKGKTLEIGIKRGYSISARQPLRVEIDMASLRAIGIAGSGKAEVERFKTEAVDFSVAGSGTLHANQLEAGKVSMSIAGSGDIVTGGKAAEAHVSIAGSGDVKATELAAEEVKVSISGSGDAAVQALRRLKVSIAGSGDVRYSGSPQLDTSIAGSGSVKKL